MESREDTVRVKEESSDTDVGDDNILDSVESSNVDNFQTFTFYESSANHANEVMVLRKKLDKKISVDFECKNVKLELKTPSNCKTEDESHQPIVKVENGNQTDDVNEKIFIDFEFEYMKPALKSLLATNFKTEDQSYRPIAKIENHLESRNLDKKNPMIIVKKEKSQLNLDESEEVKIFEYNNLCRKAQKVEENLKTHINKTQNIRQHECYVCHKSFSRKHNLKVHINAVHIRNKPFACDICHKSFGYKGDLNKHINTVHDKSNRFELHDRNALFECNVCHKSFGRKDALKAHIKKIHNRSKP
ncbi:zinc finger protein 710-like [Trichogramma pretiosum]|uniref:zinc finger protein 710-like n=1 Tax=Trichogramma pretiosum TaxID=7493 RepID=UPI0006C9C941|nr:zinc finger protein 710-like [Trichogramma pretiosum]